MASINLLTAKVGHERQKPYANRFQYEVFYVDYPVTDAPVPRPRLLSWNRFNLFALNARDHGARDGSSWYRWFSKQCAARAISVNPSDSVRLISHPRLFGYAFNPISFWLLQDASGTLRAVLCEVNNTFGDNHNYLLAHEDGRRILPTDTFRAEKNLYVSPFNKVEGHYMFSFTATPNAFKTSINYFAGGERVLATFMGGALTPLTSRAIMRGTLLYPLMTLRVVLRIHVQAVRLWLKGVKPTISTMPPHTAGATTQGSTATRE